MAMVLILLALFSVLTGYACCVAAGREDDRMERTQQLWKSIHTL